MPAHVCTFREKKPFMPVVLAILLRMLRVIFFRDSASTCVNRGDETCSDVDDSSSLWKSSR